MTVRLSDRTFLFWVLIMKRRFREWFSIKVSQQPGQVVLFAILVFNLLFFLVGALVIMILAGQNEMSFFEALYCTITMILDAGCIEAVVGDVGAAGYLIPIICIGIVIIGMITFSGAVIGYVTNYISGFIENSNSGNTSINVSEHVIILNWNSRASEIINDFLYAEHDQIIVVLSDMDKDEITREVGEKLQDTIRQENTRLKRDLAGRPFFERNLSYNRRKLKNNLTVVVRQGDIFSANQLHNISLLSAKSVIILDDEQAGSSCEEDDEIALNLRLVYDFAMQAPLDEIRFILETRDYNLKAAKESLKGNYGHCLGKTMDRPLSHGIFGNTIFSRILSKTALATDARMGGALIPVMSNSGSGNQGICATNPVAVYAMENENTEEELIRALTLS